MGQILGEVTIRVNGKEIKSKGGATLDPGGNEWTQHTGAGKVWGESKKFTAPKLTGVAIAADEDVDVLEVRAIANATITWEGDNGVSYQLSSCFCTSATLGEADGDVKAEFSGRKITRI